jgi:hypothetical protein
MTTPRGHKRNQLICFTLLSLGASAGAQAQRLTAVEARLLAAHNQERAAIGVPPLAWDPQLARDALNYGAVLSALGRLQHSPKESRPGQRENLWMGTTGAYSPEQMVSTWSAEKRFFRAGTFPAVSASGNWLDVAHYTTMIWRTTTRVGCGIYKTVQWDYLVCRYSPPGNIDGRPVP